MIERKQRRIGGGNSLENPALRTWSDRCCKLLKSKDAIEKEIKELDDKKIKSDHRESLELQLGNVKNALKKHWQNRPDSSQSLKIEEISPRKKIRKTSDY